MKILREEIDCSNFTTEVITEGDSGQKSYYIKGPFLVAEQKNKNGRIYPSSILEREVNNFTREKIETNMAGMELNHPSTPDINPERICAYIKEFHRDGNIWLGKAKVASTPVGEVVKSLLKDGYRLGVSSRSLGSVGKDGIVSSDLRMITCDVVTSPSAPGAFLNSILESKEYIIMEDGRIAEKAYSDFEKNLSSMPKNSAMREEHLARAIKRFLKEIA